MSLAVQDRAELLQTPAPLLIARADPLGSPGTVIVSARAGEAAARQSLEMAGQWGVSVTEAAIGLGLITPTAVAEELAGLIGAEFVVACGSGFRPLAPDDPWQATLERGVVTVQRPDGSPALLIGPRGAEIDRIVLGFSRTRLRGVPVLVATPQDFAAFLREVRRDAWGQTAVNTLRSLDPRASASDRRLMTFTASITALTTLVVAAGLIAAPSALSMATGALVGAVIFAWVIVRLLTLAVSPPSLPRQRLRDADLPVYTILIALYREERMITPLLAALSALDYPAAKLDIKLIVEADDPATVAAIRLAKPHAAIEVIVAPVAGPRTKPKALMAALPFARGRYVVLYDAEDRPASGQLREAAETFAAASSRLGCLQAPLRIDLPSRDDRLNWLKTLYAADYDALFGIILPAMAHLEMPLPLGGTSNHFRIEALTESGGWDPFNVTEDADLGFRLARRGWSVGTIGAATFEEAPATLRCWVKQRIRWFKGWLQTLAVIARNAPRLPGELGFKGLAALVTTVLGSTATAILHLVCMIALAVSLARSNFGLEVLVTLFVAFLGYGATALLLAKGAQKAGRRIGYGTLLALPLFWLLMGVAAIAAIGALARRPYHWAKTEHGLINGNFPAGVAFSLVSGANRDMAGPKVQTRKISSSDVGEMLALRFVSTAEKALAENHHDRATAIAAAERFREKLAIDGAGAAALAIIDAHIAKLSGS